MNLCLSVSLYLCVSVVFLSGFFAGAIKDGSFKPLLTGLIFPPKNKKSPRAFCPPTNDPRAGLYQLFLSLLQVKASCKRNPLGNHRYVPSTSCRPQTKRRPQTLPILLYRQAQMQVCSMRSRHSLAETFISLMK